MKNSEAMTLLLSLVEENARMRAALTNLKTKMKNDARVRHEQNIGGKCVLNEDDLNEVLAIGGMLDKDIDTSIWDHIMAAREE